jgi:hypothetical protein
MRPRSREERGATRLAQPLPANDDRKPAIVSTTSRKRLKLLRADKRAAKPRAVLCVPDLCARGQCRRRSCACGSAEGSC